MSKIESVGKKKQSSSFNLDPERFFVDQTKAEMKIKKIYLFRLAALWNPDPRFAQAMGVTSLARATFWAYEKRDITKTNAADTKYSVVKNCKELSLM